MRHRKDFQATFPAQPAEIMLYYDNLLDLLCPQDEGGGCIMASFGLSLQTHACKKGE